LAILLEYGKRLQMSGEKSTMIKNGMLGLILTAAMSTLSMETCWGALQPDVKCLLNGESKKSSSCLIRTTFANVAESTGIL
jgi:hypothetical protein